MGGEEQGSGEGGTTGVKEGAAYGLFYGDVLVKQRKAVATTRRSYGGPSEKFVGDLGEFSEVAP